MAKIFTSGSSPDPASRPSTIDNPGKVHGAANGITLSSGAVPVEGVGAILANRVPAAIIPYARLKTGTDLSGAKLLTLLATGIALVSPPALSQGAMGPGAPAAAPQPRTVAPTPQAPQPRAAPTPQAPQPRMVVPQAVPLAKSGTRPPNTHDGIYAYAIEAPPGGSNATGQPSQAPVGGQERSRAPLPAGYGYDATGRIVYTGR